MLFLQYNYISVFLKYLYVYISVFFLNIYMYILYIFFYLNTSAETRYSFRYKIIKDFWVHRYFPSITLN